MTLAPGLHRSLKENLRLFRLALMALVGLLLTVSLAPAAEEAPPPILHVPVWSAAPFVLLLLAIAVLPLIVGHFWHPNRNKALVMVLIAGPVAGWLVLQGHEYAHALLHALEEYAAFIILLASLYTVAGGIVIRGDVRPRPLTNTAILGFGAVLANFIGTTGASMLLIRPVLRINLKRQFVRHVPVFFIFTVSNLGGLLTPLGDPPLFLGFLRGIDFFWTLSLWPQWLTAVGTMLGIFLVWDTLAYLREDRQAVAIDSAQAQPLQVEGLINVLSWRASWQLCSSSRRTSAGRPEPGLGSSSPVPI
jgi:Na+/H+ antiporter NhaD/arsenite permease-like protein